MKVPFLPFSSCHLNEWDVVSISSSQNISPGVGEADWAFMTTFDCTEDILSGPNVDLVFDGLDILPSLL
jgi:predicted nucleic acid binding AN1-type Zn finger protein